MYSEKNGIHLVLFRALRLLIHLAYGVPLSLLCPLLRNARHQRILQHWCRDLLQILHVQLQPQGTLPHSMGSPGLIVANHISWLDVIALSAATPHYHVAGTKLRAWPLAGGLVRRIGAWFTKPDSGGDSAPLRGKVSARLRCGESVIWFPEGVPTPGKLPGHFHSVLMQSAIDCRSPVYPVAIRYHDRYGRQSHAADFVGHRHGLRSLWRILRSPELHITLTRLPELPTIGETRRRLARDAHACISFALAHPRRNLAPPPDTCTCRDESEPSLYSLMLPGALHSHISRTR